ncbi:hypothetical protein D1BOALGB6SA_2084 [Olavius sp. associated proteobacterium Delta 1]|nr:hypothetical protein D1BOALGB6SA_2084 [Olavius sp. associated proteobacterium Delta 1]
MQIMITKIAESYNPAYGQNRKIETPGDSIDYRLLKGFFTPVLAPLLQNRWLICIFAAFGVAQLLLVFFGLTAWQCPINETLGIICPGCGMTTAMAMLLQGHWHLAVQTHAFAPVVLILLLMLLVAIGLPASYLRKFSRRVERLEQKTGITAILLLSMVAYWLLRIFDFI